MTDHPSARKSPAQTLKYSGESGCTYWTDVAVEVPVNIVYASLPYAVMMLSPHDLEDFAVGFSLTEGVVRAYAEIRGIHVTTQSSGLLVNIDLIPDMLRQHMARRRNFGGRTSCGLCGIEDLEQLPAAEGCVSETSLIAASAFKRALNNLKTYQPLNRLTHGLHAAAWCDRDGTILLAREDVGRHNALDKLIGACLRAGHAVQEGFVLLTSRCSFEMIEKAAIFGVGTVVAISAPTSLAIDRAHALGIRLVAVARSDTAQQFTQLSGISQG